MSSGRNKKDVQNLGPTGEALEKLLGKMTELETDEDAEPDQHLKERFQEITRLLAQAYRERTTGGLEVPASKVKAPDRKKKPGKG